MMLIVLLVTIEICPFLFVLDWHFMEIFIIKAFSGSSHEPLLFEPQATNMSYLSVASYQNLYGN